MLVFFGYAWKECLFAMCIEEYIRNMVDLEVRPEVTFGVLGSFYQVELSFMKSWRLVKETPFPMAMTSNIISNRVNASPTWRYQFCMASSQWSPSCIPWWPFLQANLVCCDHTIVNVLKPSINHQSGWLIQAISGTCVMFFLSFPHFERRYPSQHDWPLHRLSQSLQWHVRRRLHARESLSKNVQRRGGVWWISKLY